MKSKSLVVLAAAAFMATGMAAAPGAAVAAGEKFVLVSHAPDSDSWWNTIKNAIEVAGEQMDVKVDYRNPPTGDLADMARIVEQASAADPNGIIVTIADFDVLEGPITDAVDKGIPVITINSGTKKQSEQLGALMHVGQPEYDAGFGAGKKAKAARVEQFLCVNHYITNPASVERCQGYADALGVKLGAQMIDSGQDPAESQEQGDGVPERQPQGQRHPDPGSDFGPPDPGRAERARARGRGPFRHVRHLRRDRRGRQGRRHRVRHRPAALPARVHAGW